MIEAINRPVTRFVQNWIADPLQFSGIKLEWQIFATLVLICVGWIGVSYFDVMVRSWFAIALDGLLFRFL